MNPTFSRLRSLALWFLLCACVAAAHAAPAQEGPATRALRHVVDTNPEIKHLLTRSIEQAKRINPDPLTNPAQTLEQYYDFVSLAERALPDRLIEPKPNATLYQRMDQSLSYLFFICDQPLPELEGRGYFRNSVDYHHYHFPLGGIVRESSIIPGQEMSGGYITWDSAKKRYAFDPSAVGWQALETRGRVILETQNLGLVALLPIAMSPVSSVTLEPTLKEGVEVRKGDMLGHFLFGGSDFVMVFQAGYELTLDLAHQDVNPTFPHLLMGERLGHLRRITAKSHSVK